MRHKVTKRQPAVRCLLGALIFLLPAPSHAEEATTHIIEVSPGIGYFSFDADRGIEDGAFWGLGLGLHFSRRWASVFQYSRIESETDDADMKRLNSITYHLDVYRFFNTRQRARPYLVLGLGQMETRIDSEAESQERIVIGGVGLSLRLAPKWSIRTDLRRQYSVTDEFADSRLGINLVYRFGTGESGD